MKARDRVKTLLYPVPLYFEKEILEEFEDPPYEVKYSTKYLGSINKNSEKGETLWGIHFGISPKGFVTCWLSDIVELTITDDEQIRLTQNETDKFTKHLHKPDRLGEHFIKTELYGKPVEPGNEN